MAEKLSRRKIADYAAEQLQAGNNEVLREIAAYLIESKRQSEADLLVRDIELQLANRGDMIARTSARTRLISSSCQISSSR